MRLGLRIASSTLWLCLLVAQAAHADFTYQVYDGAFSVLPNFDALTPAATGTSPVLDLTVTSRVDNFGLQFTGTITVPQAGTYLFSTTSDDGSDLRIDATTVVNNDGLHGNVQVDGTIALTAGTHSLRVRFFERTGGQGLQVSYAPPGGGRRPIPANGALEGPPNPFLVGSWSPVISWPHIAITAATLPDGRVLSWSSTETDSFPSNREFTHASLFDPSTLAFTTVDNNFHDMFCAGVATLEDGRVVASGGNPFDTRTTSFNPATLSWQPLANMNFNRWYGTSLALPSNEIFSTFANAAGNTSERYSAAANAWTQTAGADMQDLLNEQNAENGQVTVNSASDLQWWSQMAVAPDGRVIHGGPTQTWHLFDPSGAGGTQSLGQPTGTRTRMWGNVVTYAAGKVLLVGGADRTQNPPTSAAVYKIDLNGPSPVISAAASMSSPRALHNSITLPTGEVLTIGGNTSGELFSDNGAVFAAEIWNPVTDQWRTLGSMNVARTYHSTALLLKDGRVLSAGGGACGVGCAANHLDGQIFSPPYLFAADGNPAVRPAITAAPALSEAGADLVVVATGTIAKFSMVRLSATTHAINTDQRHLPIDFTDHGDGTYTLSLEPNPNVLVPGYYWMFAVNSAGVPSIGRTFQIVRNDGTTPGGLEVEAESAILAGAFAVLEDATARNGRYIAVPSGAAETSGPISPSRAVLTFSVAQAGLYKVEAATRAPSTSADSFWVTVDGAPASGFLWNLPSGAGYQTGFVTHQAAPIQVNLAAGAHTVEVIHREAGARLDWMRLVYDGPPPDLDRDGDGVPDVDDAFPDDPTEWLDTDGDGVGNNADVFPNDPTKWLAQHGVPAVSPPLRSATLIVEDSTGADRVWNVNPDSRSVTVTNGAGAVLGEIAVGLRPWALAKAPLANEVFVANKESATLSVISTQTLAVLRTLALPAASQPHGLAFGPASDTLYVVLEGLGRVDRIAASTGALLGSASLPGHPRHLAVSADGQELYVTNFITPPLPGESGAAVDLNGGGAQLFVVSASTMSLTSTVQFAPSTRPVSEVSGPGMPNYLSAPVVFGARAYVPSKQDNLQAGAFRGGPGMTFDQTVRAVTSVVDLATRTELTALRIDHDNAGVGTGAALSGDGRYLFVALETSREVAVYDTQLGFQLTRLAVGRAPQGLAFSSDGRTLYVHNFMDRSVGRFDVTNLVALHVPQTTALGTTTTVATELLAANVLLGKQLFYDAADERLARDNYLSCASCHNDGDSDGRVWDLTAFGEGLRNTVDLRGRAGTGHGPVHWTGNFDEVQDFEGQIRTLAGGTGLMSDVAFNTGTRNQPLGDPKAGLSADLDALAAYLGSLAIVPPSPFRAGAFSTQAALGRGHFADLGCGTCHANAAFTDSALNVRHDIGTIQPGSGTRLGAPLDGFDSPTLLGTWATAPYLHNGSAPTLEAAIAAHPLSLSTAQRAELAAFVRELNSGDTQPSGDELINAQVSVAFARGNPCGADYGAIGSRCVGHLLALTGVAQNADAIEDSLHVGTHLQSFVSGSSGTALANLIFDLGAPGAADAIVLWQFLGNKLDTQVRNVRDPHRQRALRNGRRTALAGRGRERNAGTGPHRQLGPAHLRSDARALRANRRTQQLRQRERARPRGRRLRTHRRRTAAPRESAPRAGAAARPHRHRRQRREPRPERERPEPRRADVLGTRPAARALAESEHGRDLWHAHERGHLRSHGQRFRRTRGCGCRELRLDGRSGAAARAVAQRPGDDRVCPRQRLRHGLRRLGCALRGMAALSERSRLPSRRDRELAPYRQARQELRFEHDGHAVRQRDLRSRRGRGQRRHADPLAVHGEQARCAGARLPGADERHARRQRAVARRSDGRRLGHPARRRHRQLGAALRWPRARPLRPDRRPEQRGEREHQRPRQGRLRPRLSARRGVESTGPGRTHRARPQLRGIRAVRARGPARRAAGAVPSAGCAPASREPRGAGTGEQPRKAERRLSGSSHLTRRSVHSPRRRPLGRPRIQSRRAPCRRQSIPATSKPPSVKTMIAEGSGIGAADSNFTLNNEPATRKSARFALETVTTNWPSSAKALSDTAPWITFRTPCPEPQRLLSSAIRAYSFGTMKSLKGAPSSTRPMYR